jgi:hypothetical protein
MQIFNSSHNLFKVSLGFFFLNFFLLLQKGVEISIFTKLSDDVHVVRGLIDVIKFDNVGMIDFLHDLDFRLDVLHIVPACEETFIDDLNSNFFCCLNDSAHVDISVRALSNEVFHAELIFFDSFLALHV